MFRIYHFLVLPLLNGKFELLKLSFGLASLSLLTFCLLLSMPGDFQKVKEARNYERPSIVYGIGKKGESVPIAEYYKFSRKVVKVANLKQETHSFPDKRNKVIQCFLSTEDNNFYSHFGIDLRGIIRAMAVNILAGRIKEGASTITQQVARLKFLSTERSFSRKAREAWLAFLMELEYDKDTILEMYLNEIPLGHGTLGSGAAARFYFRKNVNELSWGEAALISSLTTRPRQFSPLVNPNESSRKVRVVFMKLIETGRMDVSTAVREFNSFSIYYKTLNRSPNDSAFSDRLNRHPYVTEYVRRLLMQDREISKNLYTGGYKIYTSIEVQHQAAAEEEVFNALVRQNKVSAVRIFTEKEIFDENYGNAIDLISLVNDLNPYKFQMKRSERRFQKVFQSSIRDEISVLNYLNGSNNVARALEMSYNEQDLQEHLMEVEGALISLRPKSGHITAIIGGSGFRSDNQQIRPFQAYRQPGSSFKPLVYASAIDYFGKHPDEEEKVTASTLFLDSPMNYLSEDGDEWEPSNYSESYAGFIRLRSALETSRNMVALRVLDQVGLSKVLPTLYALLGIQDREIPRNISVALGTFEVTPLEIARAYAVFASGGKEVHPICILKITDSKGALIKDYETENLQKERKQIISPEASYIITSMMKGVITRGTGTAVKHSGLGGSVVGKTGTTNNFRDAWFVGYTPELVSSLWMGYDLGTMSLGKGMAGGIITAPVWGRYMKKALEGEKRGKFSFGGNLNIVKKKICKFSGKQFGSKCQKSYYEFYIKGTEPEICKDHSMIFFPGMNDPDEHLSKKKKE